jgi:flagellar basal body rod protein FlgG
MPTRAALAVTTNNVANANTPGYSNHERWLVSYADFITLLFAFFVVLYASSQVDKRKVGKLSLAIQVAFQELGSSRPRPREFHWTTTSRCRSARCRLSKT